MEPHGLSFPAGYVPPESTGSEFRGDPAGTKSDDKVGSLRLQSVRRDQKPRNWALARPRHAEGPEPTRT